MALQETLKNIVLVGSGALPVVGDVVAVTDPVLLSPKVATGSTNAIGSGALANNSGYVDPQNITAEFNVNLALRSPVSLGVAPESSKLLKLAGLVETLTAGVTSVYKLGGITADGTGQVQVYNDGFTRLVTGASANLKISGKIGEPIKVEFSVKGVTTASASAVANPAVTLNTGNEIIMTKADTFVVNGVTLSVMDFELDLAGTLERSYTTGTNGFYISNFAPKLSITAIKTKTIDEAAWTDLAAGGNKVIAITCGAPGNQILLNIPYAFASDLSENDDKGRVSMKRAFNCENGGVANSNVTITLK